MATAACGGGGNDGDRQNSGSSAQAGPKPLTERQLHAAVLEGEFGTYGVTKPSGGDAPISDMYTAQPEVCQPLVSLTEGATQHDPVAEVVRDVSDQYADLGDAIDTDLHLRSYTAEEAAVVMTALGRAGEECAGGFTEERTLVEAKVLKVETLKAPALGDEAHAFRIVTQDVKEADIKLYDYLTVVRSGSTLLSFRADQLSTKDFGGVPQDVIDAQWKKFRRTP